MTDAELADLLEKAKGAASHVCRECGINADLVVVLAQEVKHLRRVIFEAIRDARDD